MQGKNHEVLCRANAAQRKLLGIEKLQRSLSRTNTRAFTRMRDIQVPINQTVKTSLRAATVLGREHRKAMPLEKNKGYSRPTLTKFKNRSRKNK